LEGALEVIVTQKEPAASGPRQGSQRALGGENKTRLSLYREFKVAHVTIQAKVAKAAITSNSKLTIQANAAKGADTDDATQIY
jgi:hypothetical protein